MPGWYSVRFYLWSSLLLLVGFIASLEASPVPIELGWARVNVPVSGYELVVLSTSMNGYEDVVREAVGQGANVLIVASGPGKVEPLGVDVEPLPGTVYRSVLVAPGRGGVERLLLDYAPLMGVPGREYRPQRGSGFGVAASPRGYYYFYLEEEKEGGSIVALVTDPGVLLDNRTLSLIVSRLAPGGRVLWLPERPFYARVAGFFHPASLVWAAVKRLGWLEAQSWRDPVARVALALLGFGAGMAVVLVAFSLTEYRGGRGVYELACGSRGLMGRLAGWARELVWEEECVAAGKQGGGRTRPL